MALRRLMKEFKDSQTKPPPPYIGFQPITEDELFKWKGTIIGPDDSPYAGGTFFVDITIPPEYPFKGPKVQMATKVYHPNINSNGDICLDVLKEWQPNTSIEKIMLSIYSLLQDPSSDSPVVPEIGQELRENPEKFKETAMKWTKEFAS